MIRMCARAWMKCGLLTPKREALLQKWLPIYRAHRLAEGEYLNLYDLAFDPPEAHAIRANGKTVLRLLRGRGRAALSRLDHTARP